MSLSKFFELLLKPRIFAFQSILILVTLGTLDLRTITLYVYDWDLSILYFQTFNLYLIFMFLLFVCVALWLQKYIEKQQMRIQEGHFLKSVLNLDLKLSNARSRQGDAARIFSMVVGAFCICQSMVSLYKNIIN